MRRNLRRGSVTNSCEMCIDGEMKYEALSSRSFASPAPAAPFQGARFRHRHKKIVKSPGAVYVQQNGAYLSTGAY